MTDDLEDVKLVGLAIVTVSLVSILLIQFFGAAVIAEQGFSVDLEVTDATASVPDQGDPTSATVRAGLGDAVALDGSADSEIQFASDLSLGQNWTVCTHAHAQSSVVTNNENRSILGLNDLHIYYDGSSDEYRAYYYDAATRNSSDIGVAANGADSTTAVCVNRSANTVTITRNTTVGGSQDLTTAGQAAAPPDTNWAGSLDETRVWSRDLNASEQSSYVNSPGKAVPGEPPALRLMYDVRDQSSTSVPAYFARGEASVESAAYTTGLAAPSLSNSDYDIDSDGSVSVPSSSTLDGDGTVLFVDSSGGGPFSVIFGLVQGLGSAALTLLVVGVLVLAVRGVMDDF